MNPNKKLHLSPIKVEPFLKWAGGKRWLVKKYPNIFPKEYNLYVEPFLGSGSVLFFLQPQKALVSDINIELIELYKTIKVAYDEVYSLLKIHQNNHSKEYYYKIRNSKSTHKIDAAAKFLYLNRACWNGLYRVNREGKFNVPIGTKVNILMPTDNFQLISKILENVSVKYCDFEVSIKKAKDDDFIFADPPYTIIHNNNSFIKYNEKIFSWKDQIRLKNVLLDAKKRGAKIIVTNAAHKCIEELYKSDFDIERVSRHSIIAGSSQHRKASEELIIRGNL